MSGYFFVPVRYHMCSSLSPTMCILCHLEAQAEIRGEILSFPPTNSRNPTLSTTPGLCGDTGSCRPQFFAWLHHQQNSWGVQGGEMVCVELCTSGLWGCSAGFSTWPTLFASFPCHVQRSWGWADTVSLLVPTHPLHTSLPGSCFALTIKGEKIYIFFF